MLRIFSNATAKLHFSSLPHNSYYKLAFCSCGYFEGVLAHTTTLNSYLGRFGVIVTKKYNMVKTIWLKGCYITDKLILDRKNNLAFIM